MGLFFNSITRTKSVQDILNQSKVIADAEGHGGLKKVLTARDLTFFGIAAVLGAGSFSSLGARCV